MWVWLGEVPCMYRTVKGLSLDLLLTVHRGPCMSMGLTKGLSLCTVVCGSFPNQ